MRCVCCLLPCIFELASFVILDLLAATALNQFLRNYLAIPAIHFFGFPGQLVVEKGVLKNIHASLETSAPSKSHTEKFPLWFLVLLV